MRSNALLIALALALPGCMIPDRDHRLLIRVPDQELLVFTKGELTARYPVSTSKFGLGDSPGSHRTPLGEFAVARKIGRGLPSGSVLKDRRPTGEILPPNAPGRDPIVTRILWLKGLERQNRHAFQRYIYIHGTPREEDIGRPSSYGCVRMRSHDVIRLFDTVGWGARVEIRNEPL